MLKEFTLAASLAMISAAAASSPAVSRGIQVNDAWTRPAAAGTNGAGFFKMTNGSRKSETLVSVASPYADRVEMHQTSMAGGVMSMQRLDAGVVLPPGQTVTFEPGGKHLMVLGLKSALRAGGTLPLTFTLASGKHITLKASVRSSPPPATGPR